MARWRLLLRSTTVAVGTDLRVDAGFRQAQTLDGAAVDEVLLDDLIDTYLEDGEREFEANSVPLSEENPALWERLQRARARLGESRP